MEEDKTPPKDSRKPTKEVAINEMKKTNYNVQEMTVTEIEEVIQTYKEQEKEEERLELDQCIDNMINCIKQTKTNCNNPHDLEHQLGRINYSFSRILVGLMSGISYSKIAMITGVLENIKQEFYRRVASSYEDAKIVQNGDIKEYKKL